MTKILNVLDLLPDVLPPFPVLLPLDPEHDLGFGLDGLGRGRQRDLQVHRPEDRPLRRGAHQEVRRGHLGALLGNATPAKLWPGERGFQVNGIICYALSVKKYYFLSRWGIPFVTKNAIKLNPDHFPLSGSWASSPAQRPTL